MDQDEYELRNQRIPRNKVPGERHNADLAPLYGELRRLGAIEPPLRNQEKNIKLGIISEVLKACGYRNIFEVLEDELVSEDTDSRKRCTFFFTNGGFSKFIVRCSEYRLFMRTGSNPTSRAKLSTGTLKGIKMLKILEPAGFDVLLSMVQAKVEAEMEQLSNSSIMRRQMKDFDPDYIANFSLQRLAQEQLREAPVLSTILRGLANIDVGETGEEVWDKEVEEREIEEGDRDGIGAIPRYSGGGGINRLAGNDESGDESGEEEMEKRGHVVMCRGAGGKRDLMVSTAVNILCYARNQQVNAFQGMSGYLGFASNMPKRIQDSYHKIGLSVSYESILRIIDANAEASQRKFEQAAAERPFNPCYDNLNIFMNVKTTRLENRATQKNYTTGYFQCIDSNDVPKGMRIMPAEWAGRDKVNELKVEDLLVTPGVLDHMRAASIFHIYEVLRKRYGAEMDPQAGKKKNGAKGKGKKRKRGLEEEEVAEIAGERVQRNVAQEKDKRKPVEMAPQIPVLNQLPVRKSEIYTMLILDMNEARVAANIEIIKAVMKEAGIGLDEGLEDKLVMFKGDWLTARNITKAVFERLEEVKPADSLQWVEPVIGLFHLQMNILKMLMTSHWGNGKEPASLKRFVMALGRNKSGGVDESVKDFRASDRFFNDVLDGQIISKVMSKLSVESKTELVTRLQKGDWMEEIQDMVYEIWNVVQVERMRFDGEGGKIPEEERDLVYENGLLFLQHGMSYREYAHAISCGDTGRVGCVLEVWTTLLQGSGKAVNYPAEMLHLMACLKRLWSPGLKSIWIKYCLVNPSGKAGGWMPDDLFCEYVIRENKAKFKASTNSSTDGFLREKVARQIISFRDAKQMMYRTTGATNYYTKSRIVQSVADIGKVVVALVQEKVHERQPVRYRRVGEDRYREVPDLFADGTTMLMTGKPLATYLSRARANWGKLSFLEKGAEEEGEGPGLDDEDSDDDDD